MGQAVLLLDGFPPRMFINLLMTLGRMCVRMCARFAVAPRLAAEPGGDGLRAPGGDCSTVYLVDVCVLCCVALLYKSFVAAAATNSFVVCTCIHAPRTGLVVNSTESREGGPVVAPVFFRFRHLNHSITFFR